MALTVETGSNVDGKYIRFYDPDLGAGTDADLFIMQHGECAGGSYPEAITLPYEVANSSIYVDATITTADNVGECANVRDKATTGFNIYQRQNKPLAISSTRGFYWKCYWCKTGTNVYDELECGSAGTGFYANFIDSTVTVRSIQFGAKSNTIGTPSIVLPVAVGTNAYYVGGASHALTFSEISRQPTSTTTTLYLLQNGGGVYTNFDWVIDWMVA